MHHLLVIVVGLGFALAGQTGRIARGLSGAQGLVAGGKVTRPSEVPWHAAIYKPELDGGYDLLCGGTLISPTFVLTAAHCFWNEARGRENSGLQHYHVVLGKKYREYIAGLYHPKVQLKMVKRVILDPRFDGYIRRFLEYDIALVELESPVTISRTVSVAKVDFNSGTPTNGSVGVVAGWGYTETGNLSEILRSVVLPYIDHDTCYSSLGEGNFGGADLTQKQLLTWDKFCAGYKNKGKSVCPGDSGGGYVVKEEGTNQAVVRGIISINFRPTGSTELCFSSHYTGFTNIGEYRYLSWLKSLLPASAITETFDDDGDDHDLVPLDPNASLPSATGAPWHATICRPNGDSYECIAGGTLIAPNLIITAAHIVWSRGSRPSHADKTSWKVALGVTFREWDHDDPNVQRMDVQEVLVDNRYQGVAGQFQYDIALVKLSRNATLNEHVQVAAVDRKPGPPAVGSVGVVTGWNFAGYGPLTAERRTFDMPYVDQDSCRGALVDRPNRYLTSDKFCAGFIGQGKSVCRGESGGGFVVRDKVTNIATLRGIISTNFSPGPSRGEDCYADFYTGYTNIGETRYLEWINEHLPSRARFCRGVRSTTTVQPRQCLKDFETVSCSGRVHAGTVAVFECKLGFTFADKRTTNYIECLDNGSWNKEIPKCAPIKGR